MSGICQSCKRPIDNDEHRGFFFKALAVAYDNWPESHPFQADNADHFRAWLIMESGHYTSADLMGEEAATIAIVKAAANLLGKPNHVRIGRIAGGIRVIAPLSMSKTVMSKKKFDAVALAVYPIIEAAIGVGVEKLVRESGGHVNNTVASGVSVGEHRTDRRPGDHQSGGHDESLDGSKHDAW